MVLHVRHVPGHNEGNLDLREGSVEPEKLSVHSLLVEPMVEPWCSIDLIVSSTNDRSICAM